MRRVENVSEYLNNLDGIAREGEELEAFMKTRGGEIVKRYLEERLDQLVAHIGVDTKHSTDFLAGSIHEVQGIIRGLFGRITYGKHAREMAESYVKGGEKMQRELERKLHGNPKPVRGGSPAGNTAV
jgi:hypothetical protein